MREFPLDDEPTEFPVVSNDFVGRSHRYSRNAFFEHGEWLLKGLECYYTITGDMVRTEFGPNRIYRADDLTAGPICTIVLPERSSVGTYACWVEGDRVDGENRLMNDTLRGTNGATA